MNKIEVPLEKIDKYCWQIPMSYKEGMRVPGRVYADDELIKKIKSDRTLEQCANVAHLPGIFKYSSGSRTGGWARRSLCVPPVHLPGTCNGARKTAGATATGMILV